MTIFFSHTFGQSIDSGVVRRGRGGKMLQAALALKAAFSVQKSNPKGGIFGSKKATLKAAFSVQKRNPKGGIFGSKKQP